MVIPKVIFNVGFVQGESFDPARLAEQIGS